MTWSPLTEPQDFVILAGQRTPGIAKLEGFDSPRRWDVRRGPGLSGATLRFHGIDLAQSGKLKLFLTTEADWADWEAFRPIVMRPPLGERARHLQIEHPLLEGLGIRAVAVKNVSQPTPVDETGTWVIEISLLEYAQIAPALSAPAGADDAPEPTDDNERRIQQLTETLVRESAR